VFGSIRLLLFNLATAASADAAIAQSLPKLGQAVAADVDVAAHGAQTLPRIGQVVAADLDVAAHGAQTLPRIGQVVAADLDVAALSAQTLPRLAQACTASIGPLTQLDCAVAQTLPRLRQLAQIGDRQVSARRTFIVKSRSLLYI
jgi:hypothetical protein